MKNPELSSYVREQFPALEKRKNGYPIAYLDGPGGYQVPNQVIKAMNNYMVNSNSNADAAYETSRKTNEMIKRARQAFADFLSCLWDEVVFGANMTTLNFALAQALMREMKAGDKVIITEIDHEANRAPWLGLQERGIRVEEVAFDPSTCALDMDDFDRKLSPNTKVVACNYASNAVGTISDVRRIIEIAHEIGAYTVVDAVHYAAHGPIDVQAIGADFLLCSAYKFFGPHVGVMYAKKEVLARLEPMRVKPQHPYPPYKFETGTLNHEGLAGVEAAVGFIADTGKQFGDGFEKKMKGLEGRRRNIVGGLLAFEKYEQTLTEYLLGELARIPELRLYGPPPGYPRTSTISFAYTGYTPRIVVEYLDSKGIFVWDGDFFATTLVERLGLTDKGGLIRIGIAPYNTKQELRRVTELLKDKASLGEFAKEKVEKNGRKC